MTAMILCKRCGGSEFRLFDNPYETFVQCLVCHAAIRLVDKAPGMAMHQIPNPYGYPNLLVVKEVPR